MPAIFGPGRPARPRFHDYASCGESFVTVVARDRAPVLGFVADDVAHLLPAGAAVRAAWTELPSRFPFVRLDGFVVMPNHFHGILRFIPPDEMPPDAPGREAGRLHLHAVVGVFKSTSTIAANRVLGREGTSLWQRGFLGHVVRDERSLGRIRGCIGGNPEAWPGDRYNPAGNGPRSGGPG